jgi:hypothetical protein
MAGLVTALAIARAVSHASARAAIERDGAMPPVSVERGLPSRAAVDRLA